MTVSTQPKQPIVLFGYPGSVYNHRAVWYLELRGISYQTCIQPTYPPRPTIHEDLKIAYRRIPILAIGRDVYCDTRLIIRKLEQLFPPGRDETIESCVTAADKGTMSLLEHLTIAGGVFHAAVGLLSPEHEMLKDPKWVQDREELSGGLKMTPEVMAAIRPGSLANLRNALHLIDSTFLADGRTWIAGGQKPSLLDLHAVWVFDWIFNDPLNKDSLTDEEKEGLEKEMPRVFRWMRSWRNILPKAAASDVEWMSTGKTVDGREAVEMISGAGYAEEDGIVDSKDPLCLKRDQMVEISPTDYGSLKRDKGKLIKLDINEVVVEKMEPAVKGLRLHFPRAGFAIQVSL